VCAVTLACASSPPVPATPAAAIAAPTTLLTAEDHYFMSGDARLRYRDLGQGDPVILLHGLTRSLADWTGVADALARDHRVIAVDVRGFGKSTRFSAPARLGPEMAADIVRLLDHLRIDRVHLAGHSMGASIAAKVAALHPDRVRSVTLMAGPFFEDTTVFAKDEAGFAADVEQGRGMMRFLRWLFPSYPDSVIAAFNAEGLSTNDPATIGAAMRSIDALMVLPSAADRVRAPALVVVGAGDPLVPQSRWLASWWPGAQLLEIPEADHITVLYHPKVLSAMQSLMRVTGSR
jgi:pimeloyl-ACP methyl ester carboxylesterase